MERRLSGPLDTFAVSKGNKADAENHPSLTLTVWIIEMRVRWNRVMKGGETKRRRN